MTVMESNRTAEQIERAVQGLPAEDYFAAKHYLSKSTLVHLATSPLHFRYGLDSPPSSPTPAMVLGTAVHTAVFEPDLFKDIFVCRPDGLDGRTKDGKAWLLANVDKVVLTHEQWVQVLAMVGSIEDHPMAAELLTGPGPAELSMFWIDEATGVWLRGRTDKVHAPSGILADLKTTDDASRKAFERTIFNFKYHWQAAMYLDGAKRLGITKHNDFVFVAIEKAPPFAIGVYRLDDEVIRRGREEYRDALELFKKCREKDEWPGYGDEIQDIGLPRWAL